MRSRTRLALASAVVALVGVLEGCVSKTPEDVKAGGSVSAPIAVVTLPTPRLIDLGAGKCIPCKAMAPILEQLRADYAGRLEVRFIDVWQKPEEATAYRIQMIPTQIFYAADGRELARHEGFISREEILARWKALGVEL
jgi:thioredoxin 1